MMLAPTRKQEELAVRVQWMEIAGQENLTRVHDDGFRGDADGRARHEVPA